LLVLGSVIATAGLALVASGISIQQHTFDLSNVTPGTVAIIGGLILIGLAMVVRALLRVEQALIVRPMPRAVRAGEAVTAAIAPGQAAEAARVPFPPKPKAAPRPQPTPPVQSVAAEAAEDVTIVQSQIAERVEGAAIVEVSEVSLLPKAQVAPVRSDEEQSEIAPVVAARANGAAHGRAAPAVAVSGRPARRPQQQPKISVFDSLWPKTQRPAPEVKAPPPALAVVPAPVPAPQRADTAEPPRPAAQPQPAPASVLKSGVVEGMAYTLYSDGSIEAQLPGGMLRFGSITELRNHIEQNG
jgi:hypothetical protein